MELYCTFKGSVRGHHYHKEFDEYIMFVEGEGVYRPIKMERIS